MTRYIGPLSTHAREILSHKYFKETDGTRAKLEEILAMEKRKAPGRIPYFFSTAKQYPGKFMIGKTNSVKYLVLEVYFMLGTSYILWRDILRVKSIFDLYLASLIQVICLAISHVWSTSLSHQMVFATEGEFTPILITYSSGSKNIFVTPFLELVGVPFTRQQNVVFFLFPVLFIFSSFEVKRDKKSKTIKKHAFVFLGQGGGESSLQFFLNILISESQSFLLKFFYH